MTAAELVEQGVRAYTSGKLQDAARCWRDALALDPENARAVTYLELLGGSYQSAVASLGGRGAPPVVPPAGRADARSPAASAAPRARPNPGVAPVPLPAPAGPEYRSHPIPAPPSSAPEAPLPTAQPPAPAARSWGVRDEAAWLAWDAPPNDAQDASPPAPVVPSEPARLARVWDPAVPDEASRARELGAPSERSSEPAAWGRTGPASSEPMPFADVAGRAPFADLATPAPFADLAAPAPFADLATPAPFADHAPEPGGPGGEAPLDDRDSPWDDRPSRTPAIVLEGGGGLDLSSVAEPSTVHPLVPELLAPPAPPVRAGGTEVEVWMDGARELFALGDFSGSLEMIERILKVNPAHEEARAYLEQNETTLISMYESKLGPPDHAPTLAIKPEEVMWLNLDHRAGFLLAQIDGAVTYDDLFALSGLPRLDTARILAALLQERVIV